MPGYSGTYPLVYFNHNAGEQNWHQDEEDRYGASPQRRKSIPRPHQAGALEEQIGYTDQDRILNSMAKRETYY